jgi:hypothetical protein
MKKAVVVVLVMLGVVVNAALAQKPTVVTDNDPGWHKIGEITASFKMNSESIVVYGRDEFTKIKLKVTDAPINIEGVQVFYEEGDMEELAVANELQAGGETRVIDLKGTNKELEKVVFTYKTLPNYQGDKATVELYGFKARQDKSDAFRDDNDNDNDEINEEAREAKQELKEETREARDEIKEESREAKQEAREADENVREETDDVGDDVSEAAVNAASHIKDKVYVDKVGPDGQTIYIDKHDKYYYVNNEGKKVFITKLQMKDNPDKDN